MFGRHYANALAYALGHEAHALEHRLSPWGDRNLTTDKHTENEIALLTINLNMIVQLLCTHEQHVCVTGLWYAHVHFHL